MVRKLKVVDVKYLLFLIGLPVIVYLIKPGFYEPHDSHHIVDIYQMARAISSGQIPPRLAPDMTYGFSYPLYNFYYVFPFYLGALIFFVTNSLIFSFKFLFVITIFSSLLFMYLFSREFVGRWGALAASAIYLYTPYRAVQIFVRGAIGEAFVMALMPFVFYLLIRFIKAPSRKSFVFSSMGLAIFILSHNYLWVFAGISFFLLYIILFFDKNEFLGRLVYLIKVGLLAMGVSFYWWFPAIIEQSLVAPATPFKLIDHFPFIKQLIIPSWGYGASVWGPGDEISFQVGIVNLFVVLEVFLMLTNLFIKLFRKSKNFNKAFKLFIKNDVVRLGVWAGIGFGASILMMNIRSYFIWENVPFINFIQFPWRFLFLTTLFSSVLGGVFVELTYEKYKKYLAIFITICAIILNINYFKPNNVFYKADEDYLNRFLLAETYSEDYLQLPDWTSERPAGVMSEFVWGENVGSYSDEVHRLVEHNLEINMEESGEANLGLYYFPGWFAEIDGERSKIIPGNPYGQISFYLSEGEHSMRVWWGETRLRFMADLISLVSVFVLYLIYVKKIKIV